MELEKIMSQTRKTKFMCFLLFEALSSKYLDMSIYPGVTAESRKVKKRPLEEDKMTRKSLEKLQGIILLTIYLKIPVIYSSQYVNIHI